MYEYFTASDVALCKQGVHVGVRRGRVYFSVAVSHGVVDTV